MALKQYNPTSNGLRSRNTPDFSELKEQYECERDRKASKSKVRGLRVATKRGSGRNNQGRITSRFRGGGHKRHYRLVDFKRRDKEGVPAKVECLEYDPNRNAYLALLVYADGDKRYILAPKGVKRGDRLMSGSQAPISDGNAMPLSALPLGSVVHAVELTPGRGAQIARSAGQSVQLVAREKGFAAVVLPSRESRWVPDSCYATIGRVGNLESANQSSGKAGRTRYQGRRPHNRGSSMNPCDHPHGGGEGRCPVGRDGPRTPWGKQQQGKTRRRSQKVRRSRIIQRRGGKKR
jgi:large subunit ribosomal protein L2